MKTVTIDASAAASWLFPAQTTRAADAFLIAKEPRRYAAPDVFRWEIGNLIVQRCRGDQGMLDVLIGRLVRLDIEAQPALLPEDVTALMDQARSHGLRLFDAAYLAHARAHDAALASRDGRLIGAARAAGVDVFDLRD